MFLKQKGVIQFPHNCPMCGRKMSASSTSLASRNRFVIRCRSRKCLGYSTSVFAGSVLSGSKLPKDKFVSFCYEWLIGNKAGNIAKSLGMSSETVTDWSNYLREAVATDILYTDDGKIGGSGSVVEIDKSKFGKRKYHVSTPCIRSCLTTLFLTIALPTERSTCGRLLGVWRCGTTLPKRTESISRTSI